MLRLYNLHIKSADVYTSTDNFIKAQRKITAKVKKSIREHFPENASSLDFVYAERALNVARVFQVYMSDRAADFITHIENVDKIELMKFSMYALTRKNND